MDHSWLTDEQSAKIAPHLPTDTRGKERVDDPRVIGGIGHGLKSGGRRADAPREIYGPKKTLTASCAGQARTGGLFEALAQAGGPPAQGLIDPSGVEAHRCSTGGEGENRCGQAGARAVDARPGSTRPPDRACRPLAFLLIGGPIADCTAGAAASSAALRRTAALSDPLRAQSFCHGAPRFDQLSTASRVVLHEKGHIDNAFGVENAITGLSLTPSCKASPGSVETKHDRPDDPLRRAATFFTVDNPHLTLLAHRAAALRQIEARGDRGRAGGDVETAVVESRPQGRSQHAIDLGESIANGPSQGGVGLTAHPFRTDDQCVQFLFGE
ncbi:hypothetical protein SAMN02799643_05177 [Methylobacterium sp. UNCCL125]|nr:hypothetical protein SAMN02799643_05177 [Methylobacterium sp. UNCCL125]